jgi:O-antigen/teichoic acid export membrane protein
MDTSFLKHASVYGLANLLLRVAGIVLLPIYLRCLTREDYGLLEVVERMAETVGTCLLFGGFRQALLTFYSQADDDADRREVVGTSLALLLVGSLAGCLLAPHLSQWLMQILGMLSGKEAPAVGGHLLWLAILGIVLEPFTLIPLTLLQARLQSITYVSIVLTQVLFRITLCIVLVRFLEWGVAGALTASVVHGMVFGTVLCGWEMMRGAAWPTWSSARRMITFALPMLPGGLCFFLLHHGDRFFLAHWATMDEVGTYALGYKLAMIVSLFSLNPLYMVWSARMYAEARRPDAPVVFGRTFTRILAIYLLLGLALCVFSEEVVRLLGGAPYARASQVVAPVVLACFFQAASALMDAGFYVRHRTGVKLGITLATTAVMLTLYVLWIPQGGSLGAALATLGGFAFLAVATYWATQYIFPVRYEWGRLAALLALAVGLWLVGDLFPSSVWMIPAKASLLVLALLIPWYTGLVNREEKNMIHEIAGRLLLRLRGQGGVVEASAFVAEGPAARTQTVMIFEEGAPSLEDEHVEVRVSGDFDAFSHNGNEGAQPEEKDTLPLPTRGRENGTEAVA